MQPDHRYIKSTLKKKDKKKDKKGIKLMQTNALKSVSLSVSKGITKQKFFNTNDPKSSIICIFCPKKLAFIV